jgi:ParB family chromosome partitioning protein
MNEQGLKKMNKKTVLGRGLGALIEEAEPETKVESTRAGGGSEVEIELIDVNPFQPRTNFDQEGIEELASSIREMGLIQPVTVREMKNGRYQLISGERRLKAARMAGILKIPAYIRTADDQGMLEMALVENIQREDLNAIDIAISYQRLMEECNLTQEFLSSRVGKKRATVANYVRLLKLPAEIQLGIRQNKITMGHARTLISVEDQKKQVSLFYKIIDEDLSVRSTEVLVKKYNSIPEGENGKYNPEKDTAKPYEELKSQLSDFLQTSIEFQRNSRGSGKIIIPFQSDDELERIIGIFDKLKV